MDPRLVRDLQRFYPQIYLACHVEHVRGRSTPFRISSHDSSLLAHLDTREAMTAGQLARHLGVVPSTLSASLRRLEGLGFVVRAPRAGDRRRIELRLTEAGAEAMAAASVLDEARVERLLAALTPAERRRALLGMALLARSARALARGRRPQRKGSR